MPPNSYFLRGKVLEVGQDQQFADLPFRPRLQLTVQGKPSSNERSSVQEDWQIVGPACTKLAERRMNAPQAEQETMSSERHDADSISEVP